MNIIFVLIPLTLVLLVFAIWAFFWAVRTRQFENLDVEAWRILMDDKSTAKKPDPDQAEAGQTQHEAEAGQTDDPARTPPRRPGSKRR